MQEYIDKITVYLEEYSFVTENQLLFAAVLVIASFLVAWIAMIFISLLIEIVAKRTKSELDDELLHEAKTPLFRLIVLGGLLVSTQLLGLEGSVLNVITKILMTLIYLTLIFYALKASNVFYVHGFAKIAERTRSSIDDEIMPIAKKTTAAAIWIFGIILILSAWGIEIGPFLAGLGIAGLALSFAVQDSLANIFAGISLILDKVYKVGDRIELDSGEVGTVSDVGLRSTRLKTFDNELIIIPNSKTANSKIKNYVQPDVSLRVVVNFGVEYGTRPEKVKRVIDPALKNMKGLKKTPVPVVEFTEMGDSSLNCVAKFWVPHYNDAYGKKLEATDLIYKELNKAKIGIPFPTTTVYIKK
jgi:MscS family membrane protein